MQTLRTFATFIGIVDLKMIVVITLALTSTFVSIRFGVLIDMPLELIGIEPERPQ